MPDRAVSTLRLLHNSPAPLLQDVAKFVASATSAEEELKRSRVDAAEAAWLQAMQARMGVHANPPSSVGDSRSNTPGPGQQSGDASSGGAGDAGAATGGGSSRLPSLQVGCFCALSRVCPL